MKKFEAVLRKYYDPVKYAVFPLLLLLFPLCKANRGIDLSDAAYSLGNYESFGESRSVWTMLTFLSNAVGHLLTLLPFGHTLLGMKLYTGLFVGALGVLGYRFFRTKMPAWLAFLSIASALGLCWAPTTILYNYLTYFLLTLGAIFLFRGLAGDRRDCLFLAGVFLGLNAFVRFPNNLLEVLLIVSLWYYGALRKKSFSEVMRETLLCIAGYALSFLLLWGIASVYYGGNALSFMIGGVFGISAGASDYTFGEMLRSILDAYWHGFRWALYMILCTLIGIPFFVLGNGRLLRVRRLIYCLCIPVLFFVLYKWGMFNFRYYQKEAALQWGAVFVLLSVGADLWMISSRQINDDWKLIAMLSLLLILITPLGSNNHIWPVLNNLFLIAPVTFWTIYRFVRWGREKLDVTGHVPLFSAKAMAGGVVLMFLLQALGVGFGYVFHDGEDGAPVRFEVTEFGTHRLVGMRTNEQNAANLSQLMEVLAAYRGQRFLFYGDIPGLAYYLNAESAVDTTWPSLPSYSEETFLSELAEIQTNMLLDSQYPSVYAPVVVVAKGMADTPPENDKKWEALTELLDGYDLVFLNDLAVVYYFRE